MTEETENLVLHLLREMRAESAERDQRTQAQIAVLTQGLLGVRTEILGVRMEIKQLSEKFSAMSNHMHEIAIVLDHHSMRLDNIERLLGLDKAPH